MSRTLRGVGASPGIAVGRVLAWEPVADRQPQHRPAAGRTPDDEWGRFEAARGQARGELAGLKSRVVSSLGEAYAAILDAQTLLLDDPALTGEVERWIRTEGVSAGWAVRATMDDYMARFDAIEDRYLRDRAGDLRDLERRLLRLLDPGAAVAPPPPDGPVVVVAHVLGPSDTVALAREGIVALAADLGGPTSHTAILAHAFGLPAVVGLGHVAAGVRAGEMIIVDGDRGEVVVDPDPETLVDARRRANAWRSLEEEWARLKDLPTVTRDGVEILLRANIEFPDEAAAAVRYGARGIGLYRSEFLFVARAPRFPDEDDHYRTYREIAERVAPHPAIVRTLDLGGEKYFHDVIGGGEANPSLGLRGLRLCLKRPDIFVPQLRALLRAAAHADVRILLPLVTSVDEVLEVRRMVAREGEALRAAGVACRPGVPLGVMVETPAAAMTADVLARESDFLSIGTNDLIQYALAVDRGNPAVASLYEPLHPAVLRMLRFVIRSGRSRGLPISLCGEMAASPEMVPTLLGLGLRELSCPPRMVPRIREAIRAADAGLAAREIDARLEAAPPAPAGAVKEGSRS